MATTLKQPYTAEQLACPCSACDGKIPLIDPRLLAALASLRILCAHPLILSSGYRCPDRSAHIGSPPGSQHALGRAVDLIPPPGWSTQALADAALAVPAFRLGGIGVYPTHIHLDVRLTGKARWFGS